LSLIHSNSFSFTFLIIFKFLSLFGFFIHPLSIPYPCFVIFHFHCFPVPIVWGIHPTLPDTEKSISVRWEIKLFSV
jgi:hypothetical protein